MTQYSRVNCSTVSFFSIEIYATNAKDTQYYSIIMANFACMPKINSDTVNQAKRACEEMYSSYE